MEETKKEESRLKKFWDDYHDVIISVALVAVVYRVGFNRGYRSSMRAIDDFWKSMVDAVEIAKI